MAKGKYERWLQREGLLRLEGWARDGLTDEQIAKNIGINPDTLYTWKAKYAEISEALKKGKEVVDREVENALLKRALGYEYTEEQITFTTEKGCKTKKVTQTLKHAVPDTTAQIFWLRNRKPSVWRNNPETTSYATPDPVSNNLLEAIQQSAKEINTDDLPEVE